ncbi:AF4/FMR2 family member 1 isoform X2 [Austrofundulus limnaeus]|uniref:AF4/FMR2 family member 1 isoform X2 n=1 Tax=Austrofundulus limnaeus TaxID=52670 RepID=A0A2I4B2J3_AUSLI|nr:PREDICTED: AF4/FMR2 family member 1-like isoform X2 [Austrofundulus limnaeus]
MASQPSIYNEDRNLLRRRAWEQRIQETSQTKELNPDNVPLFGEPYKTTNKGDELSNRIQRMLGSYEDVNIPCPFSIEASLIPTISSQLDQSQTNEYKLTKTPFLNQDFYTSTQNKTSVDSYSSHPVGVPTAALSPNHHEHFPPFSKTSLIHSSVTQFSHSVQQQKQSELLSDLRGCVGLHQEMSAQSPDAKPLNPLHSTDHNIDMDTKATFTRHQLQGSTDYSSESASTMDASTLNIKHSPKDAALSQAKTNVLPSQTFSSLLSSKQPGAVMTKKPTAYVRPMDGLDQVVSESPELKPSPEHYASLPDLINNADLVKTKIMSQDLETASEELETVEDILREMTQSWPPLLTAVHTPRSAQPSKSPFPAKEAEQIPPCPEQKNPSEDLSQFMQRSSVPMKAAHSSSAETSSSSESENSRESDSESSAEEPPQPAEVSLVKTEPNAPAVNQGDWQLVHFIRSSQQKSKPNVSVSESAAHKQLPTLSSKQSNGDTSKESVLSQHQLHFQQNDFRDDPAAPQRCNEIHQNNYLCQQSGKKSMSPKASSCKKPSKLLKQTTGYLNRTEAALSVECEDTTTTQTKEPCLTDRPKVKMKTGHGKKGSSDTKKDAERTKYTKVVEKQKAGSDVQPLLCSHCPLCGVSPCSCPAQGPAQSPAPPVKMNCNKTKKDSLQHSSNKVPHKPTLKCLKKSGHTAKTSRDKLQPPTSLLVKMDLNLLARVPQLSTIPKGTPSSAKRPSLVMEQDEGGSDARKHTKTFKKTQNVEEESKVIPKKKRKLDKSISSSSVKVDSTKPPRPQVQKKSKKHFQNPATSKDASTNSKAHGQCSEIAQKPNKEAGKGKDSHRNKLSNGKPVQRTRNVKKASKSSSVEKSTTRPIRPLLTFDERQYPVKYYIKEAKKLKHKADAEMDKLSKAFNYLDAAMFFVESGIAIDKDPQISTSSYTMFAETVELLKYVLKLKNPADSSAPASEKDFIALCLKCQALLQMAMFRHKQKTALNFSKTLTDHFNNSAQASHSLLSSTSSPAASSTSSGPGSNQSSSSLQGVTVPQEIEQMAFSYVSITSLFLTAQDIWEQAEEVAHRGSGLLSELDAVLGPLSLTSSMSSMIRYVRQGVHWLGLDSQKV